VNIKVALLRDRWEDSKFKVIVYLEQSPFEQAGIATPPWLFIIIILFLRTLGIDDLPAFQRRRRCRYSSVLDARSFLCAPSGWYLTYL
jgi:hypothetical protein